MLLIANLIVETMISAATAGGSCCAHIAVEELFLLTDLNVHCSEDCSCDFC